MCHKNVLTIRLWSMDQFAILWRIPHFTSFVSVHTDHVPQSGLESHLACKISTQAERAVNQTSYKCSSSNIRIEVFVTSGDVSINLGLVYCTAGYGFDV